MELGDYLELLLYVIFIIARTTLPFVERANLVIAKCRRLCVVKR